MFGKRESRVSGNKTAATYKLGMVIEAEIHTPGEHYGIGNSPLIISNDLLTEWVNLCAYMILKTVAQVIERNGPTTTKV